MNRVWQQIRQALGRTAPAPLGRPENYQAEFPQTTQAFERFLRRGHMPIAATGSARVGVVVMPWLGTPNPWFSIALALGLALRGRAVTLVWDDTAFPVATPFLTLQHQHIERVLRRLTPPFEVAPLSQEAPAHAHAGDEARLKQLAAQSSAWELRGGQAMPDDDLRREAMEHHLTTTLSRVRGLVARQTLRTLITPGGVYGSSGLFLWAGAEAGQRVATYDGGLGWIQTCNNGVAAQQSDVPLAFEALVAGAPEQLAPLVQAAQAEFSQRRQARDRVGFQTVQANNQAGAGAEVLLPMNVDFDAAALGRHVHFANTAEWISATVAFVLAHSTATVAIRQHPSERRPVERSRLDIGGLLQAQFGGKARVQFIPAEAPISSYDLLDQAQIVLPFVSTIGIEAAALGKTVLVAGDGYYAKLGFVWSAGSREEYFARLGQALRHELPPQSQQAERAWLCYYLTQVCNRVWTDFTAQPADFWRWQGRSPQALYQDQAVSDLLTGLDSGEPLSLVRHRRLTSKYLPL